ncbi:unnamed protein product [[Candida] boidinii]|nr:unnamed protein product [[Candida] boidinii]
MVSAEINDTQLTNDGDSGISQPSTNQSITEMPPVDEDQDMNIILFGVYVPVYTSATLNTITGISQREFFDEFTKILPPLSSHHIILAGDWNTAPDNIPTTHQDIQLHTFFIEHSINDIFHSASPKKNKLPFTNVATYPSSITSNRRLDRFYVNLLLQQKFNFHYKTYDKICFSTHLPVNVTCYFKTHTHTTHTPNNQTSTPHQYKYRSPILDSTLLSTPSVVNYIFKPATIWATDPLTSYYSYIDSIQTRTKQLNKIIYNTEEDLQIFRPGHFEKIENLQRLNNSNILANNNYERLNDRFKAKRKQKSLIRLIPKPAYKAEYPSPNDIRPISLINSSIRIINHHITQRLIKILSSRISPLQQAFMPGGNIHRNIFTVRIMAQQLVSQKPLENYTPTESSELHHITLLDIAKAFDTITTSYIHQVLQKMDFPATFINYILDHIDNNYGQLLNGNQIYHPPIAIQNGVRFPAGLNLGKESSEIYFPVQRVYFPNQIGLMEPPDKLVNVVYHVLLLHKKSHPQIFVSDFCCGEIIQSNHFTQPTLLIVSSKELLNVMMSSANASTFTVANLSAVFVGSLADAAVISVLNANQVSW